MIQAYAQGSDLHRQTASIVLGKPVEDISKEDRQLAKAVNFGLLYGQSAKGLVGMQRNFLRGKTGHRTGKADSSEIL